MAQLSQPKMNTVDTGEKILQRLKAALKADGDFPVRAKVVTELRSLAHSPNTKIDQISDLILREPSLGTRVLHLVNSAYYQRTVPILTIKQSVLQLGMRALSDVYSGFVLMQKFVPAAQRGGIFADSVKRAIVTALISNKLAVKSEHEGVAEKGYLAGTFFNLGFLLLAFYFPQVYEAAAKRAHSRNSTTTKSITEVLGISAADLSLAIVDALGIPDFYRNVLIESHKAKPDRRGNAAVLELSEALAVAGLISDVVIEGRSRKDVEQALTEVSQNSHYPLELLVDIIDELPGMFEKHCELIELSFLKLPEFVDKFKEKAFGAAGESPEEEADEARQLFNRCIAEIKTAIEDQEPFSNVITIAMEALQNALKFDRVILLYADSDGENLMGRLALGENLPCELREIERPVDEMSSGAEMQAYLEGMIQIYGDPLFDDGWPFVAIPIGAPERAKGVIYADRLATEEALPLNSAEHAAVTLLGELLDKAVATWE